MATITIEGVEYDVNKDFTWAELMEVEQRGGQPLGRDGSLDSLSTVAAFFFVVRRRKDAALTWEQFVSEPIPNMDPEPEAEPAEKAAAKRAAKRAARPT